MIATPSTLISELLSLRAARFRKSKSRSEAISIVSDCFVTSFLAMTVYLLPKL